MGPEAQKLVLVPVFGLSPPLSTYPFGQLAMAALMHTPASAGALTGRQYPSSLLQTSGGTHSESAWQKACWGFSSFGGWTEQLELASSIAKINIVIAKPKSFIVMLLCRVALHLLRRYDQVVPHLVHHFAVRG